MDRIQKVTVKSHPEISFTPNLPDPINVIPWDMMRYPLFDTNLINIHEHHLHMIYKFVMFVSE